MAVKCRFLVGYALKETIARDPKAIEAVVLGSKGSLFALYNPDCALQCMGGSYQSGDKPTRADELR